MTPEEKEEDPYFDSDIASVQGVIRARGKEFVQDILNNYE